MKSGKSLRVLYGVQATGNGHISRARALGPALQASGAEVTFLFSGRDPQKLFDMEPFGDFSVRKGLTFTIRDGKVDVLRTVFNSKALTFARDVLCLNLNSYDLIVTDYEPVTAWAAKIHRKPSIGVGHQYAFKYDVPVAGQNGLTHRLMNHFAPASIGLGLHWDHFGNPLILPPIVEVPEPGRTNSKKILVYMDFENLADVIGMLKRFTDHSFHVYTSQVSMPRIQGHISIHPLSRKGFQRDLSDCAGVITNSGFELPSEVLQLGKKILVKPIKGQMEQISNARALQLLNLGQVMESLDSDAVQSWLGRDDFARISFPEVVQELSRWIVAGDWSRPQDLSAKIWQKTQRAPSRFARAA